MKKISFLILLMICTGAYAQHKGPVTKKPKAYNSSDYPADQYSTRIDTASLGVIKIQLIHVLQTGLTEDPACKAWLVARKGNKTTAQMFFDDIGADYGCAGIFFPKKQPRDDLFIMSKYGDFDGRLLIIDRNGLLNQVPGGDFYVSEDENYLFTNYSSDQTGVSILDLGKNDMLYSDSATGKYKLGQWYFQDDKYFAIAENKDLDDTTQITIATFDIHKKKFTFSQVDKSFPEKDSKLQFHSFYDKPENKGNCGCGKR
jgi:hypothetical protein